MSFRVACNAVCRALVTLNDYKSIVMKKIRIGNDIAITWALFSDTVPFNVEGRDIHLYMTHSFGSVKVDNFEVVSNTVTWRFKGKDQKRSGAYGLLLVINEGKDEMITTDVCEAFSLVPHSCCVCGESEGSVDVKTINVESSVTFAGGIDKDTLDELLSPINKRLTDAEDSIAGLDPFKDVMKVSAPRSVDAFNEIVNTYDLTNNAGNRRACLYREESFTNWLFGSFAFSMSDDGMYQRMDIAYISRKGNLDLSKDEVMYDPLDSSVDIANVAFLYDKRYNLLYSLGTANRIATAIEGEHSDIHARIDAIIKSNEQRDERIAAIEETLNIQ